MAYEDGIWSGLGWGRGSGANGLKGKDLLSYDKNQALKGANTLCLANVALKGANLINSWDDQRDMLNLEKQKANAGILSNLDNYNAQRVTTNQGLANQYNVSYAMSGKSADEITADKANNPMAQVGESNLKNYRIGT